jgi:hypothetical protein
MGTCVIGEYGYFICMYMVLYGFIWCLSAFLTAFQGFSEKFKNRTKIATLRSLRCFQAVKSLTWDGLVERRVARSGREPVLATDSDLQRSHESAQLSKP